MKVLACKALAEAQTLAGPAVSVFTVSVVLQVKPSFLFFGIRMWPPAQALLVKVAVSRNRQILCDYPTPPV